MRPLFQMSYEHSGVSVQISVKADTEEEAIARAKKECPLLPMMILGIEKWGEYDPKVGRCKREVIKPGEQKLAQAVL